MGRIVINETENKQTVVLNDSPEGVSGGYFDSTMNWHEMGGDIPTIKVKVKTTINNNGEEISHAKYALSDLIPFSNNTVNYAQQYVPDKYKANMYIYKGENVQLDGSNLMQIPVVQASIIGTNTSWANTGLTNISSGVLGRKTSANWIEFSDDDVTGVRFDYYKDDASLDASDFDGYAVVSGVLYHLVGE